MSSSPVTAKLLLITGDSSTVPLTIELTNQNRVIGRDQIADIMLGSLQISRKHASLEYVMPQWYIRDTSTNGISVNETKLTKGELFPLKNADIITFVTGVLKYRFRCVASPAQSLASKRKAQSSESDQSDGKKMLLTETEIDRCDDLEEVKGHLKDAVRELKVKTTEQNKALKLKEETNEKMLEAMESELSCSVCNEVFIQATIIDCGHTFCSFCIREWSKSKKKPECPLCRTAFSSQHRNIALDNYVTKIFESITSEISAKRKISIKEREEQVKKAAEEEARIAAAQRNQPRVERLEINELFGLQPGRVMEALTTGRFIAG